MVVFRQKWLCAGKVVVIGEKWLNSGNSGCIRAKCFFFQARAVVFV